MHIAPTPLVHLTISLEVVPHSLMQKRKVGFVVEEKI